MRASKISINRGKLETMSVYLQTQQKFRGSFNVSGGREHIIDFWVRDPNGAIILNSGTVAEQINFEFTASRNGEYILNFENNDNSYSKFISLEFEIESGFLPNLLDQDTFLLWVIIIALAIGLVLMGLGIVFLLRRKNR